MHFHNPHNPVYEIEVIVPIFQMRKLSSLIISILPQTTRLEVRRAGSEPSSRSLVGLRLSL